MTTELVAAARPPLIRRLRDEKLPPPAERRRLRDAAGATQQDVAEELGVSDAVVSCWERGICKPSKRNRDRYLALLQGFRDLADDLSQK